MKKQKTRDAIDNKYKWKLEDLYPTVKDWEEDFAKITELLPTLGKYRENLLSSANTLYFALKEIDEISLICERLYVYARMNRDTDNTNSKFVSLTDRAHQLNVQVSSALSYINPMLTKAKKEVLEEYLSSFDLLADYDFFLREIIRNKKYILSEKEEKLLSGTGSFSSGAQEIYTMLNNADLEFGKVKDENGELNELTHGNFVLFLQSRDVKVRKSAYRSYYRAFKSHINTISASYSNSVKKDIFYSQARGYESPLNRALFADNVPEGLYLSLIDIIHKSNSKMHEYLAFRREQLGLRKLHMYDLFAPLTKSPKKEYEYSDSVKIVIDSLKPLGNEYMSVLKEAFNSGWVDVYETKGKTSGAYSWGAYGTHPYVLLNHRNDLNSVFTISHEMGHALHSYYSNESQPYSKAGYTIFAAEVASTVNEILLTHHLLKTEKDVETKKVLLSHYLDQFRTTVFRQTMFAEFEMLTHDSAMNGMPLTPESLSSIYGELNSLYYGSSMTDDNIVYEWARIPHFYNAFYVYKYATGFSSAVKIADGLINNNKEIQKGYLNFLSSGGNDFPLEQLKMANVDLVSGEPIWACMNEFEKTLKDFIALY